MLLKCTRENETTYYIPAQVRKISISPVYGREDKYDVAFYIENTMEIIRVFDSFEEAETFVKELYAKMLQNPTNQILDLNS